MNILFATSLFTFIVVALPYWFMPYLTPKSIQFGVRIPREYEGDPVIGEIRKSFHRKLLSGSIVIFAALVLLPYYFGLFTVTLFSMPLEIVFSFLIYFSSFRKLHSIKVERGWYRNRIETSGAIYNVEETFRKHVPSFFFILPAVAIVLFTVYVGVITYPSLPSMIPTHFGASGIPDQYSVKSIGVAFMMTFIQTGMTAGMFLLGYALSRTRQEIDVSRPTTSFEQQERFKWYVRDSLYLMAAAINLTMMFSSFNIWGLLNRAYSLPLTLLPSLLGAMTLVVVVMSMGQMGSRMEVPGSKTENTGLTNKSDDKDWKGGVIYYDKQDPSVLVGKRFGVGWTFNFAKPITWVIFTIIILLPIILLVVIRLIHH